MASPTFLSDGHTPRRDSTLWFIEQKILGAINDGGGGGGGGGASVETGSGSPEGVVTAAVGGLYVDLTSHAFWIKETGSGNTGWAQYV